MTGRRYLQLKGRTWWFHRAIPMALRDSFDGQQNITINLKTSDLRVAQLRRRRREAPAVERACTECGGTFPHRNITLEHRKLCPLCQWRRTAGGKRAQG